MTQDLLNHGRRSAVEADAAIVESGAGAVLPRHRSRVVRLAIALVAVLAVAMLALLTPLFAQASGASAQPVPTATVAEAEALAARANVIDRSEARESLTEEGATAEGASGLLDESMVAEGAVDESVTGAVEERAQSLAAVNKAIDAEAERLASQVFFWPTEGGISSPWGMRFHPILKYTRLHGGADIGGAMGAPIYAVADGVVTKAAYGHNSGSGNNVRIDHGSLEGHDVETAYLHMNDLEVEVGQRVTKGQRIGTVGSTGLSTAPHLHFSLYLDGANSDPMIYLSQGR